MLRNKDLGSCHILCQRSQRGKKENVLQYFLMWWLSTHSWPGPELLLRRLIRCITLVRYLTCLCLSVFIYKIRMVILGFLLSGLSEHMSVCMCTRVQKERKRYFSGVIYIGISCFVITIVMIIYARLHNWRLHLFSKYYYNEGSPVCQELLSVLGVQ